MPSRNITTRFELDGEKQFKAAISEINSGMSVLKSEMELTSAQFSKNADSMDALTKKGDILERQILSQKDKIEVLKEALSTTAKEHGEADKRTQKWQVSLNKAEAELAQMNQKLEENKAAVAQASEATEEGTEKVRLFSGEAMGLGDALGQVAGKLGIDLPDGLQTSLNGLATINPAIVATTGFFSALVVAIGKAEKKLMELTAQSAGYADEILTTATVTRLSAKTLQEWSYAAELLDVSIDTAQGSLSKLVRSMSDARDGTGKAKDTFKELGVEILNTTDGSLRPAEDVFWDAVEALGGIANESERDAAAMEIFGRSAQELTPLIAAGRDGFKELADEAHNMGAVLGDDALSALGAVDDAHQRLLSTQEAVTHQIGAEYAPYMEKSLTMTKDLVHDIGGEIKNSGVVDSFGKLLIAAQGLLDPLARLGSEVLPPLKLVLDGVAYTLAWIADTADAAIGLLTLDFNRFNTAMGKNPYEASHMQQVRYGPDYKNYQQGNTYGSSYFNPETGKFEGNYYHASGTRNFPGGWTWVGEAGPERVLLPQGTQIQSAQESRNSSSVTNWYVTIEARSIRELNDIVRLAENKRRTERMDGKT